MVDFPVAPRIGTERLVNFQGLERRVPSGLMKIYGRVRSGRGPFALFPPFRLQQIQGGQRIAARSTVEFRNPVSGTVRGGGFQGLEASRTSHVRDDEGV